MRVLIVHQSTSACLMAPTLWREKHQPQRVNADDS